MPQPKVLAIRNYKHALTSLGQRVEIAVRPANSRAAAPIEVS